ncbi:MAG: DUF2752 domain-containing protein [Polyangiaceae bacterium]|nr:DUF2752 domain-containing protein [Polyangiaceae bacterium]
MSLLLDRVPDVVEKARDAVFHRMVAALALLLPTGGALGVSFLCTPELVESGRVVLSAPCLMKVVFGIECPTCGMTRAFMALSHGEFARGFGYNHLSPIVYLVFWGLALHASYQLARAVIDYARLRRRSVA